MHGTNRIDQRLCLHILQQVSVSPFTKRLKYITFIIMNGQDNYFDIREQLTQFLRCLNPVFDRHVDIHQYDIRFILIAEFEHLNSIAAFTDDLNVVLHI
ncbi:hypothetical protein D3C76_1246010 [compost metagenome]